MGKRQSGYRPLIPLMYFQIISAISESPHQCVVGWVWCTPCRWQGGSQEHSRSIMGTSLDHWGATPIMEGKEKLRRISSSLESVEGTGKTQWRSNSYFMLLQTQITRSSSVHEILPLSTYSLPLSVIYCCISIFPQGDLNKSY